VVELTTILGFTTAVSLLELESLPHAATSVVAASKRGKDVVTRTAEEVRP
jgi:hypothetical protein